MFLEKEIRMVSTMDVNAPLAMDMKVLELVLSFNFELLENPRYQHLYILSDETPKAGDSVFDVELNVVGKRFFDKPNDPSIKKIIATTDGSLGLPLIGAGFIKDYVDAFKRGENNNRVLVEYNFVEEVESLVIKENSFSFVNIKLVDPTKDITFDFYELNHLASNFAINAMHGSEQPFIVWYNNLVEGNWKGVIHNNPKPKLFTEEQIMNALHQVELKHNKDYSKMWNELKENLK